MSLVVHENEVTAKVKGSFSPYYMVNLEFPRLSSAEQDKIVEVVVANPQILGAILNGELPADLLLALRIENIELLPTSWNQILGGCNCPDHMGSGADAFLYGDHRYGAPKPAGAPCKHMAAVYFMITLELDRDPFTIFTLRGFDLAQRCAASRPVEQAIPYPLPLNFTAEVINLDDDDSDAVPDAYQLYCPRDLPKIPPMSHLILSCLQQNPPFSSTVDFHQLLGGLYAWLSKHKFIQKQSRAYANPPWGKDSEDPNSKLSILLSQSDICVKLNTGLSKSAVYIKSELLCGNGAGMLLDPSLKSERVGQDVVRLPLLEATWLFSGLQFGSGASPSCNYFAWASNAAIQIMLSNAFIPDVLPLDTNANKWKIVYKPFSTCQEVQQWLDELCKTYVVDQGDVSGVLLNDRKLCARSAILHHLSAVFSAVVSTSNYCASLSKNKHTHLAKDVATFFLGQPFTVLASSERSTASSVCRWISVFDLMKIGISIKIVVTLHQNTTYKMSLLLAKDQGKFSPLCRFIKEGGESRTAAVKLLNSLAPHLHGINKLAQEEEVVVDSTTFEQLMRGSGSLLASLGVQMELPKTMHTLFQPRPVVHVSTDQKATSFKSYLNSQDIAEFDWRIAVGPDLEITVEQYKELVAEGKRIVWFKDRYVEIDPSGVQSMLSQIGKKAAQVAPLKLLRSVYDEDDLYRLDNRMKELVTEMLKTKPHTIPQTIRATLREYQVRGFEWLSTYAENSLGCILADDMGLGKTLQAITLLQSMKDRGLLGQGALVVVPTTLLGNWLSEIYRFAPSLNARVVRSQKDTAVLAGRTKKQRVGILGGVDVVVTSYGIVRSCRQAFQSERFSCLIIDEAQQIKNCASQVSKAVKSIPAGMKLALSGTPVENRLAELHSIFDFVLPGYLGTLKDFEKEFARGIEAEHNLQKLERLKTITAPFVLRRLKTDKSIIADLPQKNVSTTYATLTPKQAALYEGVVEDSMKGLDDGMDGIKRRGNILAMLTKLKQVCNHPANFSAAEHALSTTSGKAELLLTLLEPILASGEKVLIFSQYVTMAKLLGRFIEEKFLIRPLMFNGEMSQTERERNVSRFQRNPSALVLLLSLKVGTTSPSAPGLFLMTCCMACCCCIRLVALASTLQPRIMSYTMIYGGTRRVSASIRRSHSINVLLSCIVDRSREPSDRSRVPHRAEEECFRVQACNQGLIRREDRRHDGEEEGIE
eukprot:scaffold3362_cov402-Prasinococcus_capsulatus_cf.AAC.5